VTESAGNVQRAATGIAGLDDILGGGLPFHRLYLVRGSPGVGKTTLALQFLLAGVRAGEKVLYITLSETEDEIRQVAASHGWSLDGVDLFELSSAEQTLRLDDENTLYAAEDVDLKETVRVLLERVQSVEPQRVVFDSLSEIRLLAHSPVRYRRQLLSLKQFFAERQCTVLLLDDHSGAGEDQQVASLAHGVLALEQTAAVYGGDRRRVRVVKLRGSPFRSGYHDFCLRTGGLVVYPRLTAAEHRTDALTQPIGSDIPELDAMLGGGIDCSTSTLLMGPAGVGKSGLATQFALAANRRGEAASVFLFEERVGTWRHRCLQLGMDVETHMRSGALKVHQVDPAELAPDEFSHLVRADVEAGARVVVIDSIRGYLNAMLDERYLSLQLHELLAFLGERQVASVLTMAQSGLIGTNMVSPVDVSYLADTVVLLRYYESAGSVKKALSVLKKRAGTHEDFIRELGFGPGGIKVGQPLINMHGVLSGVPRPVFGPKDLVDKHD
jgi:circadian clock protein KaiC